MSSKPSVYVRLAQLQPYVLTGVLLGLPALAFSGIRFEFLAWFGLVPMLVALRSETSVRRWFGLSFVALSTWFAVGQSWILLTSPTVATVSFFVGGAALTVPMMALFFLTRHLGRRRALWTLPFIWTAWEWIYHQCQFSFGGHTLANTQTNAIWLFQFMDLTGVWGMIFWVVLFNVLVTQAIDDWQGQATDQAGLAVPRTHLVEKLIWVTSVMVIPPLIYSAFCFWKYTNPPASDQNRLSVLMVQPNVNPWVEANPERKAAIVEKTVLVTDLAVEQTSPDLIVWPEVAIPLPYRQSPEVQTFLGQAITDWNAPLLTGTLDLKSYATGMPRPKRLDIEGRDFEVFNTVLALTPNWNDPQVSAPAAVVSGISAKNRLVPFVEHIPYVEHVPWLRKLVARLGSNPILDQGATTTLTVQTKNQRLVKVGTQICYESLYPESSARLVREGAQFLVFVTNDGWFSQTQGAEITAAASRMRAIETRRSVARCANTGKTLFFDPLGRSYGEIPWWQERTTTADISLSHDLTLYTQYGDVFPLTCLWGSALLLVALSGRTIFSKLCKEKLL